MKLTKIDAAKRQLDFAIASYFEGKDIVPLYAVAGAAHILVHDLIEASKPGATWAKVGSESAGIPLKEALASIRKVPNWLKHANRDAGSTLDFTAEELDFLLFHAVLDLGELIGRQTIHSNEVSVFRYWFVAKYKFIFQAPEYADLVSKAVASFPDVERLPPETQLACGLAVLSELRNST